MRQHKASPALLRLKSMRSTHAADGLMTNPKYHWMEFIFHITSGEMCPLGLVLNYCKKSFFPEKMSHNGFSGAMIILALNVDAS